MDTRLGMEGWPAEMRDGRRLHDIGDVPGDRVDLRALRAVSGELRALDGVGDVAADLVPGGACAVTVTGDGPLARQARSG